MGETARHDEQRRHQLQHAEHVRVAQKLQQLMVKLCNRKARRALQADDTNISRHEFLEFLDSQAVNALLDDLDVTTANRKNLFELLDSDGSGTLTVQELIAGIMKVRGHADKSDIVAAVLGVKAMHSSLRTFEQVVLHNLKGLWFTLSEVGDAIKNNAWHLGPCRQL